MNNREMEFTDLCQKNGWRRTVQRRAVYDYIVEHPKVHPYVEDVWRAVKARLPHVSLDSVYRILDEFVEVGILARVEHSRAVRYDTNTTIHDHFICSQCGKIFDFRQEHTGISPPECEAFGKVSSAELVVRGVCKECLAAQE